jgi:hypothetical protein
VGYNSIRIERDRNKYNVSATDPAIQKANEARDAKSGNCAPWQDPSVEYSFDTKEQVMTFLDKAIDIALPVDEYTSAFDKLAKEALKS